MSEVNETIFSNLVPYVKREVENIINQVLEHKPYDELHSS
jgi:hypothetical protein